MAIDVMPLPDGGASGKYFTGWFFKDGSVDGDWGTEAAFPLVGDGIETTVTVYSRWSDEAREDGSCKEFAFILTDEAKTFTLSNGVYVFRYDYKKTEFGFLSLQCSLEALDFAYIFSVEDTTGKTYHQTEFSSTARRRCISLSFFRSGTDLRLGVFYFAMKCRAQTKVGVYHREFLPQ